MDISALASSPLDAYIQFKYPEIKDLLKHFLSLISATLVFSVTFSEKVIDFHKSATNQKFIVFLAWILFSIALAACGLGIYLNYLTAEAAISAKISGDMADFLTFERLSYMAQDAAALLYVLGLFVLVSSAIVRVRTKASSTASDA
ncbi:MAG: hypothetical protein J0M09_08445 [Xanthomonadales bacterium]|nr:hypothetical protein [Xanthomonadales bacterium]